MSLKVVRVIPSFLLALFILCQVSTASAQVCVAPPAGLVSWWTGDTGESDLYGQNNPSAVNAVTLVPGEVLDGFTFGTGGYIDIPASSSLANQTFTWDAWVEPQGPGPNNDQLGNAIIEQAVDNTHDAVSLLWRASPDYRFVFGFGSTGSEFIYSKDTFPPGTFYLVAGTYDGSTFRLYVNGVLEASYTETKTIDYTSRTWGIGSSDATLRGEHYPRTWNGVIDEVEAFNIALSAAQIQSIYNAGSAGKCKTQGLARMAYVASSDESFGTVNLATGAYTRLGNTGVLLAGLAAEPDGSLYGARYPSSALYRINPATGTVTLVGSSPITYYLFGSTTSGVYAVDVNGNLYSVNTQTAATTLIGPTGLPKGISTAGASTGASTLYVSASTGSSPIILYSINTSTGAATEIGNTGVFGLGALIFENGNLYGASGASGTSIYTLNISTGLATLAATTSAQPIVGLAALATTTSLQSPGSYSFTAIQNTQTAESIQFTNPGNVSHSATLTILNPNSVPAVTFSSSNSITVAPGQTQTVSLVVDSTSTPPATYNGILVEAAIDDGTTLYTSININVVQQDLPDLQVGVNDIQPAVVNPDSTVTLSANIHNLGTLAASNIPVQFLDVVHGITLGQTVISQLSPNASAPASVTVSLASGNYLIEVLIDPGNTIQESNKTNNQATQVVQVGSSPPLISGGILVTGTMPTTVYTGSLFTVSGQAVYDLIVNGTEYTNYVVMGGSVSMTVTSPSNAGGPWVYGNLHSDINGNFSQAIVAPTAPGLYNITITVTDYTFIGTRELAFTVVVPPPPTQPPTTPAPPGWGGGGSGGGGGYEYDPGTGTFIWCWTCDGGSGPPNFPVPASNLWVYSSDITFSDDNPALNEEITLIAQIHYWASDSSLVAQNVPINFLVTYPGLPQVKVGQTVIPSISVLGPSYGSAYTFANWRNLAEGIYIVEAQIDPSYVEQYVLDNAATRAIIVGQPLLAGQGAVSGHVTGPLGGLASVTVTVVDNTGTTLGSTVTDQTGFYLMSNVPVGQTQVTIVPPTGYVTSTPTQTVAVSDQQIADADFSLTATTSITTVTSSVNPANISQKVTYTATVTPAAGSTATGTITFQDGSVKIATVTLSSSVAAYATSYKLIGSHSITAIYSGDANNQGSTSATLTEQIKATSKTVTTTSGSPSLVGQPVTFTATVTSTAGSIPDGETVTFDDGSAPIGTGTTAHGTATFTTSALSIKSHTIKATYIGDASFDPSSGSVKQAVIAYTTTTALSASPSPSAYGQAVLLTAVVTTTGTITPTGKVTFRNGATSLGTETLDGTGTAMLTTTKLLLGSNSITASYGGDAQNGKSTSSDFAQTVDPAQITMTLTSSPNPSPGKSVRFTATLSSNGSLPKGELVTFTYNGTTLGTGSITSAGTASLPTTALPAGSDVVTATYAGSANYSSASNSVTQTVK